MANSHEMGTFRFFGPGIMKNYPIILIFVSYVFSWDGLTGVPPFCLPIVLRIFSRAKKWPFLGPFWMEILVYPNVKISHRKSYHTIHMKLFGMMDRYVRIIQKSSKLKFAFFC